MKRHEVGQFQAYSVNSIQGYETREKCRQIRYFVITLQFIMFAFLGFIAFQPSAAEQGVPRNLQFMHVFDGDLAVGSIDSIFQDKSGFIWLGGRDGLARYDGYELKLFTHDENDPTSLSHHFIENMELDRHGRLWVASLYGINLFRPETQDFQRYSFGETIPGADFDAQPDRVLSVLRSRNGTLWVGAGGGAIYRFNEKMDAFERFAYDSRPEAMKLKSVNGLSEDSEGNLWFALNRYGGVGKLDIETESYTIFTHNPKDPTSLGHNDTKTLIVDHKDRVWVGTRGGGVSVWNPVTKKFKRYAYDPSNKFGVASTYTTKIFQDSNKNIWIASDAIGLQLYREELDGFITYNHDSYNDRSIMGSAISEIFEDSNGNIWLGSFSNSLDFIDFQASNFTNFQPIPEVDKGLRYSAILSISEDERGGLWVGTEGGLNYLDRKSHTFSHYPYERDDIESIPANAVTVVLYDSRRRLWIGTWGGGLARLDPARKGFLRFNQFEGSKNVGSDKIWALHEDSRGVIWVGTQDHGLNWFDEENATFVSLPLRKINNGSSENLHVWAIYEDSKSNLWVGSDESLAKLDSTRTRVKHYTHDENDPRSISISWVKSIYEDLEGFIWVGTHGGGLNRLNPATGEFERFSIEEGLPNDVVTSILEDEDGYLWVGTEKGLSRFNKENKTLTTFTKMDGLACNTFRRSAAYKSHSGELIFGCGDGFSIFNPKDIKTNNFIPPIVFTDFKISNSSVAIAKSGSPLKKAIGYEEEIILTYRDSVFTLEFSALSYRIAELNQYAYKLEGFDDRWNHVGTKRTATYTNIDPGRYIFRVKGANSSGIWSDEEARVRITILPPWWLTWWAKVIYGLVGLVIALLFIWSQRKKVLVERERVKRLEEVAVLKDQFLANTSHELRTPLNGIIGLAESLIEGVTGDLPELTKRNLSMIVSSGSRLANLVSEILDFSKLKEQKVKLNRQTVNLRSVADTVIELTRFTLDSAHEIELINDIEKEIPNVFCDLDRIQQILHNLLNNAIKFTERGRVSIYAVVKNNQVCVHVADTGIGIEGHKIESIFESFEQIENSDERVHGGAGLGLSIVRLLVELHGGTVSVESDYGNGSTFSFTLPISKNQEDVVRIDRTRVRQNRSNHSYRENFCSVGETGHTREKAKMEKELPHHQNAHILVVDDEAVNRLVLLNYLQLDNYRVTQAEDAPQAMSLIESGNQFDLILLDIMMPRMSGFEMCRLLREKYPMYALPVLFLTAKNQVSDLVAGFDVGANDFLAKPVSREELSSRVKAHLSISQIYRNMEAKLN